MNLDVKILTKILAMRLGSVFLTCADINLRRLYINLQVRHDNREHSLDNEKVFNSVEWNYRFAVLTRMGIPQNFLKWLHLIYLKPTARVWLYQLLYL